MSNGRVVGAAIAVWVVRVLLNYLFYGVITAATWAEMAAQHEGLFREVVPAFIATDALVAALFVVLFVKAGAAFGGGLGGGATLGLIVGLLFAATDLYYYFSVTYMTMSSMVMDMAYQVVLCVVMGVVAAMVYKTGPGTSPSPATA